MTTPPTRKVTTAGIEFYVQPTFRFNHRGSTSARKCFISNQTLAQLAERSYQSNNLPDATFRQYEREITGIACRMALAGVAGAPMVLKLESFCFADA